MDRTSVSLVLICLVSLVAAAAVEDLGPQDKIVGGVNVNISDFPWQVALLLNGRMICGGAVVSEYWVLSAAHCVVGVSSPSKLQVRVGSDKHNSGGETLQVESFVAHQAFNESGYNDISALKTRRRIPFSAYVAPARLPARLHGGSPPGVGSEVTVSGWGRTGHHGPSLSPTLMAVHMKVLNFSVCENFYGALAPLESQQICAGSDGKDSCNGDSGGAMVQEDVLVGIVSYGTLDCGQHPAVYTRVSAHRDWIEVHAGV